MGCHKSLGMGHRILAGRTADQTWFWPGSRPRIGIQPPRLHGIGDSDASLLRERVVGRIAFKPVVRAVWISLGIVGCPCFLSGRPPCLSHHRCESTNVSLPSDDRPFMDTHGSSEYRGCVLRYPARLTTGRIKWEYCSDCRIDIAVRSANAAMVKKGFAPSEVGMTEPSTTCRPWWRPPV